MSYSLGNDGLTQIDIVAEYEQCYKMYVNINEVGHHARMIWSIESIVDKLTSLMNDYT